jgi:hypothetical protein
MGYTTSFDGQFNLSKPLAEEHSQYLHRFSETRRMKRNSVVAEEMSDLVRKAAHLPIGTDACYFVGGTGYAGQDRDQSIVDYNRPPVGQPGLWCQWIPNNDGSAIEWNGAEKFYDYIDWLKYVIDNFLQPWGYVLNGTVEWQGEEPDDRGRIIVKNSMISIKRAKIVWEDSVD